MIFINTTKLFLEYNHQSCQDKDVYQLIGLIVSSSAAENHYSISTALSLTKKNWTIMN